MEAQKGHPLQSSKDTTSVLFFHSTPTSIHSGGHSMHFSCACVVFFIPHACARVCIVYIRIVARNLLAVNRAASSHMQVIYTTKLSTEAAFQWVTRVGILKIRPGSYHVQLTHGPSRTKPSSTTLKQYIMQHVLSFPRTIKDAMFLYGEIISLIEGQTYEHIHIS